MALVSRPEPTLSVLDVSTGHTVTVTLEDGGMESIGALVPKIEEKIKLATGNPNLLVNKLACGTAVVWQWHTHQDSSSRTLDYYLLDGEVWLVKSSPPVVTRSIQVTVKTIYGKTVGLNVTNIDTVAAFKRKFQDKEGVPSSQQRILFTSVLLRDGVTLGEYNVMDGSVLHLVIRLRGGGDVLAGVRFVDIGNPTGPTRQEWSGSAPRWRVASPGLCLEGVCEHRGCPAYKEHVVMNQGFGSFDLIEDGHSCGCPICGHPVVPTTCAFNSCRWKWVGKKMDPNTHRPIVVRSGTHKIGETKSTVNTYPYNWTIADNAYHRFDEDTSGSINWLRLKITTESIEDREITCALCLLERRPREESKALQCGHEFHSACFDAWSDIGSTATCPHCLALSHMTPFQHWCAR